MDMNQEFIVQEIDENKKPKEKSKIELSLLLFTSLFRILSIFFIKTHRLKREELLTGQTAKYYTRVQNEYRKRIFETSRSVVNYNIQSKSCVG